MFAFRHVEDGTICLSLDVEGYGEPDWEALPTPPEEGGPWCWVDDDWVRDVEPAWDALRIERDKRLAECDWSQLTDVPEETTSLWQPYRQSLRDLPDETEDPFSPTWPTPPA